MLVVRADHLGMCFGVKDALNLMRQLPSPERVTVHGELVHNPVVTEELDRRGFQQQSEVTRSDSPGTPEVLITAHGVSNKTRQSLIDAGLTIHDTTCPLVRRVHKAALRYQRLGYKVVVVGRPTHVEVKGLVGDLTDYAVVASPEDVVTWDTGKLAVVNQTTTRPDLLEAMHKRIRELNPGRDVELVDTICQPTRDRQNAVENLLDRVEALVVVGGPNSNNTLQLGRRAERRGLPWWRVTDSRELRPEWFQGLRLVGLTAGTSTTDETLDEVARELRQMGIKSNPARVRWSRQRRSASKGLQLATAGRPTKSW